MHRIDLTATVTQDRRLIIELPIDIPIGEYDVIVHLIDKDKPVILREKMELTLEEAREIFLKAGRRAIWYQTPEGYVPLTPEERMRMGIMPPGSPDSSDLINEDRGEY